MVRNIAPALAQIGRLATPAPEALGLGSQDKSRNFFREICRILPWVIYNYKLDELITLPGLRRNVGMLIRKNAHVQDPRVIDILIYKGREDLEAVYLQHKQRHHLIQEYLAKPDLLRAEDFRQQTRGVSPFLNNFYRNVPHHQSIVDIQRTVVPG